MDVVKYKIRIFLDSHNTMFPSTKYPINVLGTVLAIIPSNILTLKCMNDYKNIPYIICGKHNYEHWEAKILVRWDNDKRGRLNPCKATLYSTTIPICSNIWENTWEIRRAPKDPQLQEMTPRTLKRRRLPVNLKKIPLPNLKKKTYIQDINKKVPEVHPEPSITYDYSQNDTNYYFKTWKTINDSMKSINPFRETLSADNTTETMDTTRFINPTTTRPIKVSKFINPMKSYAID